MAAGLGPLAVGTDGGGSIRIPASFCGIYGLKPSFGRVPQNPGFPGWETLSHTGPMTRTVRDAALMLDAIAGPDDRDRHSLPAVAHSFLAACDGGIAGLSVAWSPDLGYARVDPEVAELCAAAAECFESFGGHVEVVSPSWDDPEDTFRITVGAETWSAWGDRLEADGEQMDRSLRALLRFGSEVTAAQYLRAMRRRSELWTDVQRFLARFDLLITPTVAVPAFEVGKPGLNRVQRPAVLAPRLDAVLLPVQSHRPARGHRPGRLHERGAAGGAADRRAPSRRSHRPGRVRRLRGRAALGGSPAARRLNAAVHFALVCLGGAVGTGARYLLGGLAIRWLGGEFPHGTLVVNVIGSFLIGLVQELALGAAVVPENVRVVLAVGILGGFTTYSAFAYESLRLAAAGSLGAAVLYVGLTTALCFAACLLGIGAARLVAS